MDEAKNHMEAKQNMLDGDEKNPDVPPHASNEQIPSWTIEETRAYAAAKPGTCVVVLDNHAVDVTTYLSEHVRRLFIRVLISLTIKPASQL